MKNISFLGLGVMGMHMAANLARSEKFAEVNVWNRTLCSEGYRVATEAGAKGRASAIEAARNSQVICVCVTNASAVKEILFRENGILRFLQEGSVIVDFSTIGATAAIEIAQRTLEKNVKYIDVPVSGGDIGAKKGSLTLMVGAEEDECNEVSEIFDVVGSNIYYCGEVGKGQLLKSVNQLLCSVHMVALCEAFLLAEANGLSHSTVVEACSTGAAGSWALENLGAEIVKNNYNPGFMVKHMLKDLQLVDESIDKPQLFEAFKIAKERFKKAANLDDGKGNELGTQAAYLTYSR